MQKKLGVTVFVSEIKRVVNYTDFVKLCHIIEHGLPRFIVKNIEGESTEANGLIHICRSGSVAQIIPNVTNVFTKFNPLRGN